MKPTKRVETPRNWPPSSRPLKALWFVSCALIWVAGLVLWGLGWPPYTLGLTLRRFGAEQLKG